MKLHTLLAITAAITFSNTVFAITTAITFSSTVSTQNNTDKLRQLLTDNQPGESSELVIGQIYSLITDVSDPADPNTESPRGGTAMHWAAFFGNSDLILVLSNLGANVNAANAHGITPLHVAAQEGQVAAITELVRLEANVDATDAIGATPLHHAAQYGQVAAITELVLRLQANVDAANAHRNTPLHLAAGHGQVAAITELVRLQANVNAAAAHGNTPLHLAAGHGQMAAITELVRLGAHMGAQDHDGFTPLQRAAQFGHIAAAAELLRLGVLTDQVNNAGMTAMGIAANNNSAPMVALLIAYGANPVLRNIRNMDQTTSYILNIGLQTMGDRVRISLLVDYAVRSNNALLAELILRSRARDGESALHVAVRLRLHGVLPLLIPHMSESINALNDHGLSALHLALMHRDQHIVGLLLHAGASATVSAGTTSALTYASYVQEFQGTTETMEVEEEQPQNKRKVVPEPLVWTIIRRVINHLSAGLWFLHLEPEERVEPNQAVNPNDPPRIPMEILARIMSMTINLHLPQHKG